MAFNPSHTFQKNRRFWMAAILMICMVSFVFCTGMKGDMAERFGWLFGRRGTVVAVVGGRNVSSQDLYDLKMQRNVANEFMRNCTEIAFKKVSKIAFEEKMRKDDKNPQAREQFLFQLFNIRTTLYERKARPRYFDLGVKFDDLLEFKLWQAVADKLDIRLDDDHVNSLLDLEMFSSDPRIEQRLLSPDDFAIAQRDVKRNFQNVTNAFMHRAVAGGFRVRIAQEAVLTAQPFQFYTRGRPAGWERGGFSMKFSNAEMPDEIRAPLTLAQLWEAYKTQRAEYDVTLLPVHVEDFLKNIKDEPTELEKAEYFKAHKDKPADPGADERGLQLPLRAKFDYVLADPTSKEYLGVAQAIAQLKTTNPIYLEAVQSPLAAAVHAMVLAQIERIEVEGQYRHNTARPTDQFNYRATSFSQPGAALPIMTWLAKRHPEAPASMIANGFAGPANDIGSLAGYMAWGALKHPEVVQASMKAEAERRAPHYAAIVAAAAVDPLATLSPYFLLGSADDYPRLPVETVQHEIEERMATKAAEARAQQNMQTLRLELEKADGDSEKYRRVLKKLVPEMNLTYGPPKKDTYYNRYAVEDANELAPLKEAYLKYLHLINLFEARDMTPERLLKPGDFWKLFFDSSEGFAAASPYHVMPWPPKAKTNAARMWKAEDPRLIDRKQIREQDLLNFKQQMDQTDPLKPPPDLDLFKDAEKPILFWRTAERIPERPIDYAEIDRNLKKYRADWDKFGNQAKKMEEVSAEMAALRKQQADLKNAKGKEADLDKIAKDLAGASAQLRKLVREAQGGNASALRARQVELKEKEADLEEVKRLVVEGWRFDRARTEKALPKAEEIAREFLTNLQKTKLQIVAAESAKLKRDDIELSRLAPMYPEMLPDKTVDYFKPPLPKDKIPHARDDMMDQAVRLFNLKEPIKIGNTALDDINKALFDLTRTKKKNPEGEYVQILTNKPRSVFYVAVVTLPAEADKVRFGLKFGFPEDRNVVMRGIYNAMEDPGPQGRLFVRDHFAERIQQQDAKVFRANVIRYFKSENSPLGKFEIEKEDAKRDFDERGGSD